MNKKVTSIVAYITIIGWLIAFLAGDKEGAKQHLNQALVLAIVELVVSWIPFIGGILGLVCFVFQIWGIVKACQDDDSPLPLVGGIQLLK